MSQSAAPEKPGARSSTTGSRFRMRSLRPVSARIISYGRETQAHRHTTLYVLRVSRSGTADWYVAKRYSEFRALHAALQRQFSDKKAASAHTHTDCDACEELQSFYASVQFPERHRLQSRLGWSKKRIEASRMEELDGYVRFLLETTQGLLNDDDDDDNDSKESAAKRCQPLELIREFLMVNEDNDAHSSSASGPEADGDAERPTEDATAAHRRWGYRLSSRGSSVTSLSVRDLNLVSVASEKKASPVGESMRNLFADDWWDPTFADVFDDCAAPPEDAFVHRQVDDASTRPRANPLRLMDSFPRR